MSGTEQNEWFSSRRFMVTGGAGFLGRRIVDGLHTRGATEVFVPRSADYDLRTLAGVQHAWDQARPDVVIHAAAVVGGIGANAAHPGSYFFDNAMMGMQVVDAAMQFGVEKLVTVGTVCSYPKFTETPFREEDLWDGYPEETNAPYGIAKKAILIMQEGYRAQYGLNSIFLMPANLYGPGDNFDPVSSHVIPALIRKFVMAVDNGQQTVPAWGTGSASREFLYVDDAADGIIMAAERYNESDPVNLGTGQEITIQALAEMIGMETGFEGEIEWDASQPDGQPRRSLDTSRAKDLFGFEAKAPLEEGLRETIRWYQTEHTS